MAEAREPEDGRIPRRIEQLRRQLRKRRLDALYVSNPLNVRYLSDFRGGDSTVLLTGDGAWLITDFRYTEQAQREAQHLEIRERTKAMVPEVKALCRGLGLRRIGFESAHLSQADYARLAGRSKRVRWVACTGVVEEMRQIKDAEEVAALEAALDVAQKAYRRTIRPGRWGRKREFELALRLDTEMRRLGAEATSFETICALDAGASEPHHKSGQTRARRNCSLLVDWGAKVDGYCSDLTRVCFRGSIPSQLRKVYRIVLDAQKRAIEKVRPGVPAGEVDAAARDYIAGKGYGPCFGHSVGHGVGLEVHEGPGMSAGNRAALKPGMVVTIEPGIYLKGRLGVRIEDVVLVTGDGRRVLSNLPKGLASATVG